MIIIYFLISLINVILHIVRSILVIKSSKLIASLANCICYTFSVIANNLSYLSKSAGGFIWKKI